MSKINVANDPVPRAAAVDRHFYRLSAIVWPDRHRTVSGGTARRQVVKNPLGVEMKSSTTAAHQAVIYLCHSRRTESWRMK